MIILRPLKCEGFGKVSRSLQAVRRAYVCCSQRAACSGHKRGRTYQQAYQIRLGSFLRKLGFQLTGGNYSMVLGGVHPQMDKGHPC